MEYQSKSRRPDPRDLLALAGSAVVDAGSLLRAEFHRPGGPRGTGHKAPIDTELEQFLKNRLLALHDCDWHGEEIPRKSTGHNDTWVVDPQDGTRAFLNGLRGSAISVALVRDGAPVLGIVFAPTAPDDAGDFFSWAEGLPVTRNGVMLHAIGSEARPFALDTGAKGPQMWSLPRNADRAYGPDTVLAMNGVAADYAAHNHATLAPARVLAMPSIAYRLALAAADEVDAAISLTDGLDPYDVAGGHALLIGVGGEMVQLNGEPITYGKRASYKGCIGGRPAVLPEIVRRSPRYGTPIKRLPARPARRVPCRSTAR